MIRVRIFLFFYLCLYATISINNACDFSVTVFNPVPSARVAPNDKHFVIVTASYNNALLYEGNLVSTLSQSYKNFEIIITDDCSPDGTADHIRAYLEHHEVPCKVTVVCNKRRRGALQNIYRSIAWCNPDDIIVLVDGDDRLAHSEVLSLLNEVYADPEVWMTHGRLINESTGTTWEWQEPIPQQVVHDNSFRSYYSIPTHVRTFYTWLFRKIQLRDLLYTGNFFPVAQDVAWVIPLIELCAHRHRYIDSVTYLYNDVNPLMDAKINRSMQLELERVVRTKPAYTPLAEKPQREPEHKADVVIYQKGSQNSLEQLVTSVIKQIHGINTLSIICSDALSSDTSAWLVAFQKQHPTLAIEMYSTAGCTLKRILLDAIFSQSRENEYVLFMPDDAVLSEDIDLVTAIHHMQMTQAYGFYFNRPSMQSIKKEPHCDIDGVTGAWHFAYTPSNWIVPGMLQMALYKKETLAPVIKALDYNSFDDLENHMKLLCDTDQIGLFNAIH